MWVQYMQEVLGIDEQRFNSNKPLPPITALSHGSKLVSADYHGAEIEVVRSRCAGRVGSKGIVVRDTKFTFVIVTEKDVVKSEFQGKRIFSFSFGGLLIQQLSTAIPKEQTVFRFTIPSVPLHLKIEANEEKTDGTKPKDLVFELHGSQFENRPVDRANKKFKWKNIDYV